MCSAAGELGAYFVMTRLYRYQSGQSMSASSPYRLAEEVIKLGQDLCGKLAKSVSLLQLP